jgi:hypothetical protein
MDDVLRDEIEEAVVLLGPVNFIKVQPTTSWKTALLSCKTMVFVETGLRPLAT